MEKFIKNWWPLLLIVGWWLWKRHEKKQIQKKQSSKKINTREEAIQYLKENFSGISGAVGWSHSDLGQNDGPYPEEDGVIYGLSIGGENVTAESGYNLMAAFRVLFGNAPVKAIYIPPFEMTPFGMSWPEFRVIFSSNESATEAREFLASLFGQNLYHTDTFGDWVKTDESCPLCGKVFYRKVLSDGTVVKACPNRNCINGDEQLVFLIEQATRDVLY